MNVLKNKVEGKILGISNSEIYDKSGQSWNNGNFSRTFLNQKGVSLVAYINKNYNAISNSVKKNMTIGKKSTLLL